MRKKLILFLMILTAVNFSKSVHLQTHFKANNPEPLEINYNTTKEIGLENGVMVSIEKDEDYGAIYLRLGRLFNRVEYLERLDADTVFGLGSSII